MKYELMYIIAGDITGEQESAIVSEIGDFVKSSATKIVSSEVIGKRKLAYPIKRNSRGTYVLIHFEADAYKLAELDHKLSVTQGIIRYLVVKVDQFLPMPKEVEGPVAKKPMEKKPKAERPEKPKTPKGEIEIDLDMQIEQALGEDLSKQA
jgi:small subunit ribosomal protein S6